MSRTLLNLPPELSRPNCATVAYHGGEFVELGSTLNDTKVRLTKEAFRALIRRGSSILKEAIDANGQAVTVECKSEEPTVRYSDVTLVQIGSTAERGCLNLLVTEFYGLLMQGMKALQDASNGGRPVIVTEMVPPQEVLGDEALPWELKALPV